MILPRSFNTTTDNGFEEGGETNRLISGLYRESLVEISEEFSDATLSKRNSISMLVTNAQ